MIKEKKFYDLLIRIYRSPETLIKINRKNKHSETSHYNHSSSATILYGKSRNIGDGTKYGLYKTAKNNDE